MKVEVHVARKDWRCQECSARIPRGTAYTLESFLSPERWAPPNTWVNRRYCQSCRPIAADVAPAPAPCSAVLQGDPCNLSAGHHPATDHEFSIGLF